MPTPVNDLKEWEEYEESWENKTKSILLKDEKIKGYPEKSIALGQLPF